MEAMAFRRALLSWYDREKRELPWRGTRDPYRVWLSEIMLQQTRAEAVAPRYEAFLTRFPTVAALAAAGRRSVENGCGCSRCRFEPRTNVIRMTEPAGDCCCSCCCCNCAETDRAVAPSVSCEAVEAFKQAYADRSCGGNRRGCGCR